MSAYRLDLAITGAVGLAGLGGGCWLAFHGNMLLGAGLIITSILSSAVSLRAIEG